jgi:hypothetical protein
MRRGNLYWLVDKTGKPREGAVDRSQLLAPPSDSPKNVWHKPETVVVRDEPPKETVRIRVKPPSKPAKESTGPNKELIGKTFTEKNITTKLLALGRKMTVKARRFM